MVSRKVCRKLESADALLERIEFLGCDEVSRIYFPDEDPLNRVVTKGLKKGYIVNYSEWEEILLVGEGDFSFSLGLARALGDGTNMIATSLDRPDNLHRKYSNGIENVRELRALGCRVLHGIAVRWMSRHAFLQSKKFHKIVFNFPYANLRFPDECEKQIRLHRDLMKGFFSNARALLAEGGEVHVSHKLTYPYDEWHVEEIAEHNGLQLIKCVPFRISDYPGYSNKRGYGNDGLSDTSFPLGASGTFKFTAADQNSVRPRPTPTCFPVICRRRKISKREVV
ncbi:uncharacterized protein At4g26485-like [Nymphaea colorata]|nr:uncharacterized protein At4g26485-like [Nymphaea colorata]